MRFVLTFINLDGDDLSLEDVTRCEEGMIAVLIGVHVENLVTSSSDEKSVEVVNAPGISLMSLNNPT